MFDKKRTTADGRKLYETLYGKRGPEGSTSKPSSAGLKAGAQLYWAKKKAGLNSGWKTIRGADSVSSKYLDERPQSDNQE